MNGCFLASILMGTIYLFAEKFSYIVLNKAVYEKVVEMSTKRRQCRNNPDIAKLQTVTLFRPIRSLQCSW